MKKIILTIIPLLLMTGCWDERLVKDINLIYSQALDKTDEGLIETTIVTIGGAPNESGAQVSTQKPAIISAMGNTPRDSRMNLDRKVSGELYASKKPCNALKPTTCRRKHLFYAGCPFSVATFHNQCSFGGC